VITSTRIDAARNLIIVFAEAPMSQRVLIVTPDLDALDDALHTLTDAGFDAIGAATFEEASRKMSKTMPDLLIADQRLGAFNGLHLIARGHARSPEMRAIVTTRDRNAGLESDARRMNALCLITPADAAEWLGPVCSILGSPVRMSA
jgi:DNA-binding NtrC family response regulator